MIRALIGAICLFAATPTLGIAQMSSVQAPSSEGKQSDTGGATTAPVERPGSGVPQSGVIRPNPDTTRDLTVVPPNVDPKMQVTPPGTPGGDGKVEPK